MIAAFGGRPESYEWGVVEQYGSRVKVIYRRKKDAATAAVS